MGANPKSIKVICKTCGQPKIANCTHTSEFRWRGARNKYQPDCKACERAERKKAAQEQATQARRAEKQMREENPHHGLVGGILRQTRLDWEKYGQFEGQLSRCNAKNSDRAAASSVAMSLGYLNPREHIMAFMESAHYLELCDLTGLNPQDIRKRIGVE